MACDRDSTYFRSATYHDDGTGRDVYGATWSIRNSYWPRRTVSCAGMTVNCRSWATTSPWVRCLSTSTPSIWAKGRSSMQWETLQAAPGGVAAHGIARWDGTAWQSVRGPAPSDPVYIREGSLWDGGWAGIPLPPAIYVTGAFTAIGGVAAQNVARWDGSAWSALDQGLADPGAYMLVNRAAAPNELVIATTHSANVGELGRWNGHWSFSPAPTSEPYQSGCEMAVFDAGDGPQDLPRLVLSPRAAAAASTATRGCRSRRRCTPSRPWRPSTMAPARPFLLQGS